MTNGTTDTQTEERQWHEIATAPLDVVVETKIDDADGERNVQKLVQKQREIGFRPLWWTPDGSMYVYYTPTHWRAPSSLGKA